MRATAERLGAIQIDSVNVLARAHYLPTFSRYGAYPMTALDDLAHGRRELFEYWGHAACFLPIDMYPLMRWRMDLRFQTWGMFEQPRRKFMEAVYQEVAERGPLGASEISIAGKSKGPWWGWSEGKVAVELLFRAGRLAIAGRRNFERLYDVPERVFPKAVLEAPAIEPREARKQLFVRATRAMGIGTARDIAQYFHVDAWWDRMIVKGRRKPANLQGLFDELVEERRLQEVRVEGWKRPGYMIPGAKIPASVHARAIVSPFDPLMWERRWTKSIFDFDYQIEIYVPAPKRVYGYYVLPFLLGDRFAARVDLKADRKTSTLIVHAAWIEEGRDAREVASELAEELRAVAAWLSLEQVKVAGKGDLARALRRALASM
ncbi:MAG TPA: crosslink repair DNA glycosylase YcaQ family protein [Gemmatimonadaceae bacterium]|nr:crosslink repair DNA glycosylase YcaQ family protein [Gemmatimonadaceae bacterium]